MSGQVARTFLFLIKVAKAPPPIYDSEFTIYHLNMFGTLYLVATPIGNLSDISVRAIETLKSVDIIACEDTRHTGKLLKHFDISKKLISYHDHNENQQAEKLISLIKEGQSIAIVSDAGTPGISDPGYRITQAARENNVAIVSIPGASAFINAVIISGLPTDSIFFGGFLPSRKGERLKRLKEVSDIPATLCFYETPHRIAKSLTDCLQILGNRKAVIVRELTKLHEETLLGTLKELEKDLSSRTIKGEIVVVIDRNRIDDRQNHSKQSVAERIAALEEKGLTRKNALKQAAKEMGVSKSEAYRIFQSELAKIP